MATNTPSNVVGTDIRSIGSKVQWFEDTINCMVAQGYTDTNVVAEALAITEIVTMA